MDVTATNAPTQEVGHLSAIILHMAHGIIDPTPAVPVKITVTPINPTV